MVEWIRWWKDRTFLTILAIACVAMLVAGLCANLLDWGWILSCIVALLAGFLIRKIVIRKIEEENNAKTE